MTLAGSLPLAADEADLLTAVREVADRHAPIDLTNHGVHRLGDVLVFDVHRSDDGGPNQPLLDLVTDLSAAVRPLLRPTNAYQPMCATVTAGAVTSPWPASEFADRDDDFRDEVREFIDQLGVPHPASSRSVRLAVYRLHDCDWSTSWWNNFWWEHVQSFPLAAARAD